jgi:tRNA nucleotidyltransferase (CCA-adding enzyme)
MSRVHTRLHTTRGGTFNAMKDIHLQKTDMATETETIHDKLAQSGIKLYEVGGAVRDKIMGIPSHDIDFTAVLDSNVLEDYGGSYQIAFSYLAAVLGSLDFQIYLSAPEYGTIRAHFPRGNSSYGKLAADFVLARKDGPSSDGRRPDYVLPGSLTHDLARRDLTMNAMAIDPVTDDLIDPFNGLGDIRKRVLRFVGDPMTRLREDGLRALRAIRFAVTKGLNFDAAAFVALRDPETATLLRGVSIERRREELERAFAYDSVMTMEILIHEMSDEFVRACFEGKLRLSATMKDS